MYCKKCGYEIDDDSEFCKSCGAEQKATKEKNAEPVQEKETQKITNEEEKPFSAGKLIITLFLIVPIITMLIFFIAAGVMELVNNNDPGLLTRDAKNSDIEVDCETNLSELGVDIVIMPNTDIDGLKIKLSHYDKDGNLLKTQTKTIGNVKEGVQVEKTISITEFSMTEMLKIYKTQIEVIDGTVSYIQ